MFRIFFFILVLAGLSFGLSQVADMDGKLIIQWPGGEIQPTLMQAVIVVSAIALLIMFAWSLFRMVLSSPASLSQYFQRKKQKKGLDALSGGLIALGSGDKSMAQRMANFARKALPNDPMTQMLRVQAAQLQGDTGLATRIYESMLGASDTEIMGLRGLYLLALEQKAYVAAEQYAARAVKRRQDLPWAVNGLFDLQCKASAWRAALETLVIASDHRHIDSKLAKRYRAVLLTALAVELEEIETDEALGFASEATRLAPKLVPAAVVAGRINASKGQTGLALKIIRKCWKLSPHPDLAMVSAYARPGDSVRDRLERIATLANLTPGHREAALAVSFAAIEAKDWAKARAALGPLVRGRPSKKICTLMARIEAAENGDKGLVREWLARAVHAPLDPAWVADGVVYDEWAPVSPVTGKLDAFQWAVPEAQSQSNDDTLVLKQMISGLITAESLEREDVGEAKDRIGAENQTRLPVDVQVEEAHLSDVMDTQHHEQAKDDDRAKGDDQANETVESDKEFEGERFPLEEEIAARDEGVPAADKKGGLVESEPVPKLEPDGRQSQKPKRRRRKKTKIYVAPPAPDDPGTEAGEGDSGDDPGVVPGLRPLRY